MEDIDQRQLHDLRLGATKNDAKETDDDGCETGPQDPEPTGEAPMDFLGLLTALEQVPALEPTWRRIEAAFGHLKPLPENHLARETTLLLPSKVVKNSERQHLFSKLANGRVSLVTVVSVHLWRPI